MHDDDSHENQPKTPPRAPNYNVLPPYTPLTPLRKRAHDQNEPSEVENTPIKDVNLAAGASIIVRGVGANKKNSDPVKLMNAAIVKIRTEKPSLAPVTVKPFNSRNDWTTSCYIQIEANALSRSSDTEPRADLLILWMTELAGYDRKWNLAWTPAKYGQDKKMWVRFPDLIAPIKQDEAKEKVLAWADKHNYMVCSSYFNKGGVTLTMASPTDVEEILDKGHVVVPGLKDQRQRVQGGRQIDIQNPFELIIIGPSIAEYEGLCDLIGEWIEKEFSVDGESTLAGIRTPPKELESMVFHMTTWSATASVLSPARQTAFIDTFGNKYNILPPQLLHKVNTESAYRIQGTLREDFTKGAESMNKGLLAITRRLDDMEQQNKQQHQMTQLQLTAVTTSLTAMTNSVSSLEDRVTRTQHAILAQSREVGLTRNITDNSVNALTLRMRILLESDPQMKASLQNMLEQMESQGAHLAVEMQSASSDFQTLVNQAPVAQISLSPSPISHQAPAATNHMTNATLSPAKRPSADMPHTPPGIQAQTAAKKRRVESGIQAQQDDEDMEKDKERDPSSSP